jgi:hypothetical protein
MAHEFLSGKCQEIQHPSRRPAPQPNSYPELCRGNWPGSGRSSHQTERPGCSPGLSDTFYYENFKSSSDAAPQICAYQPHTVWLLRVCTVNTPLL